MLCLLSQNNLRPVINAQWHTPCIQAIVFFYFTIILLTFLSDKIPGTTLLSLCILLLSTCDAGQTSAKRRKIKPLIIFF